MLPRARLRAAISRVHRLQLRGVAADEDHLCRTARAQAERDRAADAPARSGDGDDATVKLGGGRPRGCAGRRLLQMTLSTDARAFSRDRPRRAGRGRLGAPCARRDSIEAALIVARAREARQGVLRPLRAAPRRCAPTPAAHAASAAPAARRSRQRAHRGRSRGPRRCSSRAGRGQPPGLRAAAAAMRPRSSSSSGRRTRPARASGPSVEQQFEFACSAAPKAQGAFGPPGALRAPAAR